VPTNYAQAEDFAGAAETCRIGQTLHSLFGASNAAAEAQLNFLEEL